MTPASAQSAPIAPPASPDTEWAYAPPVDLFPNGGGRSAAGMVRIANAARRVEPPDAAAIAAGRTDEWGQSPELQAEFGGSRRAYELYREAIREGRARIFDPAAVGRGD